MSSDTHFRILVGSYEHNLLCLLLAFHGDTPVFQPVFHFQAHSLSIKCIDVAKRYLVTGSNDEHIRIYDLQKRKELGTLLLHQGTVTTLKFSREVALKTPPTSLAETTTKNSDKKVDGRWLLSGSEDGKIIIWRTKDWEPFATLKGHTDRVADLDIHPSGRVAISVLKDQTIRLWNLMTAKKAAILKIKGRDHRGEAGEFVAWIDAGSHFVVGLLNLILIYKTDTAKCIRKIRFRSTLMNMQSVQIKGEEWFVTAHGNGSLDFFKLGELLNKKEAKKEAKKEDEDEDEDDEKNKDEKKKDAEKNRDVVEEYLQPEFSLLGHTNRIKDFTYFCDPHATSNVPYIVSVGSEGKIVVWDLDKRDQVAIYDTGERLNCVAACADEVEKMETVKRMREAEPMDVSGSEYETDGEEIKQIMGKKKGKKSKKAKRLKVSVTLE